MNKNDYSAVITSPIGKLGIVTMDDELTGVEFLSPQKKQILPKDVFTKEVIKQLQAYFQDPKFHFDLPLQLSVTAFQGRVLNALQKIPTGKTRSYSELAERLKSGARAVGNACRHNPVPIVVPCHRIVAKQGLGGFSGSTQGRKINIKRWLLEHEGVY